MLSPFLKLVQKQQHLGVVAAQTGEILHIDRIHVPIQIRHHLLKARTVEDVAGNAVVLIPAVDDCAVVGGVLGDDEFLVLDGDVVLFVVIAGETDVSCGHVFYPFRLLLV